MFVGLVERYDESVVALEHALEQLGETWDLAYPHAMNKSRSHPDNDDVVAKLHEQLVLEATELDEVLYRRAEAKLDERIKAIQDFDSRLQSFRQRCSHLSQNPPSIMIKPPKAWTCLSA